MERVHFIGIGGAGMAPLAAILLEHGAAVSGSDREANAKTAELARRGAVVHIGHDAANLLPEATLAVYSSAVPEGNPERRRAAELKIPQLRRGEFLAELTRQYRRLAAVSGSHGKTSVTAMLAHILVKAELKPGFLIGAAVNGGASASAGAGNDIFVSEVDESDATHTLVRPWLGIVPNVDDDHCWSVGGEAALRENFRRFGRQSQHLIYYAGPVADELFAGHPGAQRLECPPMDFALGRWHGFQAWNAQLAIAAAGRFGVAPERALALLDDFPGVARRMSGHYVSERLLVYEDYAHHPAELASSIAAFRGRFPRHHLRVVFQPHRYARLAKYLPELAAELGKADSAIVTPVFAAWSETGPVSGADLAAATGAKARYLEGGWPEIARKALEYDDAAPLLLAVIGAGDIEQMFHWLPGGENA